MTRPPAAVIVAALLTGLQGLVILSVSMLISVILSVWDGREGHHRNDVALRVVVGSISLLGLLVLIAAIMAWTGSRRWAVGIAVFDVVVLALEICAVAFEPSGGSDRSPPSSSVVLGILIWNLVPLICLLLPSSRRWSGSRPKWGQTPRKPEPLSRQS